MVKSFCKWIITIIGGVSEMTRANSFIRGASRVMDLGAKNKSALNTLVRYSDKEAMAKDWENVGKSIEKSIRNYRDGSARR